MSDSSSPFSFAYFNSIRFHFRCSDCDFLFNSSYEFNQHSAVCAVERVKIENIVEEVVTSEQDIHASKPYECSVCSLRFARSKALVSHGKLHRLKKEPKINSIKTNTKAQKRKKKVVRCVQPPDIANNDSDPKSAEAQRFACSECDKRFMTKQKMLRHQWIHRKKSFSCEICAKHFQLKSELNAHRLQEHAERAKYVCNRCGKSFASRQGRWEHLKSHSNDSLYSCGDCPKKFSSRQGYLIHLRTHKDERPFACT